MLHIFLSIQLGITCLIKKITYTNSTLYYYFVEHHDLRCAPRFTRLALLDTRSPSINYKVELVLGNHEKEYYTGLVKDTIGTITENKAIILDLADAL